MKVGHFQCEVAAADFQKNLNTVLRGLLQAQAEKVEVLCFPESLLTGYFSGTVWSLESVDLQNQFFFFLYYFVYF